MFFQLPFFFIATYAFWKGNYKEIRTPSLVYAAHVSTTVLSIISQVLVTDFTGCVMNDIPNGVVCGPQTMHERLMLCSVYVPYLLVPLLIIYVMLTSDKLSMKSKRF
jgi:hypothetical protein